MTEPLRPNGLFSPERGRTVAIYSDGPLSFKACRNLIRFVALDLEMLVEAEAKDAGIDLGIPAWVPGINPNEAEQWWQWFSAVWRAAQAIEARRAETQGGSVHESAVSEGNAP